MEIQTRELFIRDSVNDTEILIGSVENIQGHIEALLEELDDDEELEVKIYYKYMTQDELDNLPEWNG